MGLTERYVRFMLGGFLWAMAFGVVAGVIHSACAYLHFHPVRW